MLKVDNLSVEINGKEILKDFNLNININEIHAIMGPNGIGKVPFVRLLWVILI